MARFNSGSATSTKSRALPEDAAKDRDPREVALAAIDGAYPKILLRAARLVDRFGVGAEFTPETLVQDVTVEVLDGKHGSVDPVAYCFVRMLQLVSNSARNRATRAALNEGVKDAVHPTRDLPTSTDMGSLLRAVMEQLTSAACDDEDVFALLTGFAHVAERDDVNDVRARRRLVLEASGLDAARYGLALKRLATFVRSLPGVVRDAALFALGDEA